MKVQIVLKYVYLSIILSIWSVISFPKQISHLGVPSLYDLPAILYLLFVFYYTIKRFRKKGFDLVENMVIDILIFIMFVVVLMIVFFSWV